MRRVWLLETLQRIVTVIHLQEDVENVLPEIARTIYEEFGLVSVGIGVLEDGWIHYRGVASQVSSTRNRVPLRRPDGPDTAGFGTPHPMNGEESEPGIASIDAIDRSAKVPIRVNGEIYGVLSVAASIDSRLTGEELEVLEQIAAVLGSAIERSRKRGEQLRRLEDVERLQQILTRIQEYIEPRDAQADVLEEIERTYDLTDVRLGVITGLDIYFHDTYQGALQPEKRGIVVPVSKGIEGRAARSGRVQVVNDAQDDPDYVFLSEADVGVACIPIWSVDEVIGILRVSTDSPHGFSQPVLDILDMLADRFSMVMSGLRRKRDLEQRAAQLMTLERMISAVSRLVPTRAAIDDVAYEIQLVWGKKSAILMLAGDELSVHGPAGDVQSSGFSAREGIVGRVVRTGEAEFVREAAADPDYTGPRDEAGSLIAVPIRLDDNVIGVLHVESTRDRGLDDLDFETLVIVGNHLGIALGNYVAFSSEQDARKALEAVQRVSTIVAQTLDPVESLKLIAETLAAVLRYQIVAVEVVVRDKSRLAASFGFPPGNYDRKQGDDRIASRVMSSGELVFLERLSDDPGAHPLRDDARSGIYVPIRTGEAITGVLTVQGTDELELSEWDVGLLRTFAEHVGVLLANTQTYDEMRNTASLDSITGIANHRFFLQHLRTAMEHARREEQDLSLLVIDIDAFKDLNDRFGHIEGDNVLAEIARRLNKQLRSEDLLARYAGDEFVVVLPGVSMRVLLEIAARLLRAVRARPFEMSNGETAVVTLSIGAATYPADAETAEELISAADTAMYLAKGYGRDAVCHFRDVALLDAGDSTDDPVRIDR